jgi:uncharacterized protein YegP (UPF0339 family)
MAAKVAQFEYWHSNMDNLWYWRLRGKNGRIVAQSEGYARKSSALKTIETIQESAHGAIIEQVKEPK